MSNTPPPDVAREIKDKVYEAADDFGYLQRGRVENGQFIARLAKEKHIGERLKAYMGQGEVRTYIKDAVLNRYSKDKQAEAFPDNIEPILSAQFGDEWVEMERAGGGKLRLHRNLDHSRYVVSSAGTYLKWETALRKALLYIPGKPFSEGLATVEVLLVLYGQNRRITEPDRRLLSQALARFGAKAHICGA